MNRFAKIILFLFIPGFVHAACENSALNSRSPIETFLQVDQANVSLWQQVLVTEDGQRLQYIYRISDVSLQLEKSEVFVAERAMKDGNPELIFVTRTAENLFSVAMPSFSMTLTSHKDRDQVLSEFESKGLDGHLSPAGDRRIEFKPDTIHGLNQFLAISKSEFAGQYKWLTVSWLGHAGPLRSNNFTKL